MHNNYITKSTLENADIDLTGQDVEELLADLNDTLQERVSTEITESLADEQLQELIDIQESATEDELIAWLEKNVPNMQQIVQNEIDILLDEITESDDDDEE